MGNYQWLKTVLKTWLKDSFLENLRTKFYSKDLGSSDSNILQTLSLFQQQKDLCYADMLFVVYTSPNTTASYSASHGTFKKSVGSQTINDKQGIYNIMVSIYGKYSDEKLSVVQEMQSNLEWINSSEDDYDY